MRKFIANCPGGIKTEKELKVLITESRRNCALICASALALEEFEIHGMDNVRLPLNIHFKKLQSNIILPHYDQTEFQDALEKLLDTLKPDVIVPNNEIEWLVSHREKLEQKSHFLCPEMNVFMHCYSKQKCYKLARDHGINIPQLYNYNEAFEILDGNNDRDIKTTLVLKPDKDFGNATGLSYLQNVETLETTFPQASEKYGDMIIQEYIPGPSECMIALNLLYDRQSRLIDFFCFNKIRQYPVDGGTTGSGVSMYPLDLLEKVNVMLEQIAWIGPVDAEFKVDVRDGIPKLIEINPRFTGALKFSYKCGVNFALSYCKAAMGEKLPVKLAPTYEIGVKWTNPSSYFPSVWTSILRSEQIFRDLFRLPHELKGIDWRKDCWPLDYRLALAKLIDRFNPARPGSN